MLATQWAMYVIGTSVTMSDGTMSFLTRNDERQRCVKW